MADEKTNETVQNTIVSGDALHGLNNLTKPETFSEFSPEVQDKLIDTIAKQEENKQNTGIMGELFGNYTENISRYIAFIISLALISVGGIYILLPICWKQESNVEFWQIIAPIITGALGYVFGAGSSK